MRKLFFLAFLFCCGKAFSQDCKDQLVVGHIDSLHSNILNEERKLWISVPDYKPGDGKKFPVIYMPDAEMFFITSQAMVQVLRDQMPDAIVVGIVNTDRNRDLTPTHVTFDGILDSNTLRTSGGAEKFEQFIDKELIPYIESKYPTEPYRILSGHSFGGLFTVYTFVHHNSTFNAWIVSDPSLWWDNGLVLKQAQEFLKTHQLKNQTLFLGFANSAQSALGLDTNRVKHDTSLVTRHMRSIFALRDALQQNAQKDGFRWDYKYYPAEVHGSVYPLAQFDALKFMFDYYLLREADEVMKPGADAAGMMKKHYENVSKNLGYTVLPSMGALSFLAHDALNKKDYAKAKNLFELWLRDYPNDSNAYEGLGDYQAAIGDKKNAADNYRKALSIDDNADLRKKLDDLSLKK